MRLATLAGLSALLLAATGGAALAFGTIHGLGQNAEHERITRRALGCGTGARSCIMPRTLGELAGRGGSFGAVGAPDRGPLIFQPQAHCDRGDYLPTGRYPQTQRQAQAALEACRAWMDGKMEEAVRDARGLLDDKQRLRPAQVALGCAFVGGIKGRAKCNVLEDFGVALHTAQDFYAHSNWVDIPDRSRPLSLENPPGLGHSGWAPWMALRANPPFPRGLITGCYGTPEARACAGRVMHAALNKDTGVVDPRPGLGTSPRGRINGNFARAVEAATLDSRDKWDLLRERLVARYGVVRGRLMACAIAQDDPMRTCRQP